jgi:hypothetical protein
MLDVVNSFFDQRRAHMLPKWQFDTIPLKQVTGSGELGSKP